MSKNRDEYDLIHLWLRATEGLASEVELAQLNQLLETDAEARQNLIQLTGHESWLFWNGLREAGIARAALEVGEPSLEVVEAKSMAPMPALRAPRGRWTALREFAGGIAARGASTAAGLRVARIPLVSYRMAALVACLVAGTWWMTAGRHKTGAAGLDSAQVATDMRAEIVDATVCVWNSSSGSDPKLGHQFHEGDTLQLLEGVAELKIASPAAEANLQLEGPVALEIGAGGIANLRYGKMAVQVSRAVSGFQVATSFGRVSAPAGAEIGISTFGNSAEVHVFEGTALLESPWIVSDDGELSVRGIRARDAVRLIQTRDSSMQALSIPADRGLFTTHLSMDANYLSTKPGYVQAIRDSKPVCYWRFEKVEGNRVPNEMGKEFTGYLTGDYRLVGPSGNQALELGVAPDPGAMRVNDSWDEVLSKDFSFEFWMRPNHYHVGTILGFAGPFDWSVHKNPYGIGVEIQGGWGNGATTNRVRFLYRSPLSLYSPRTSLYSDDRYATRSWQHVVATHEGSLLKLYLDGKLVQTGKDDSPAPKDLQLVVGQLYTDSLFRPFIGYLDELAIYDRALSDQEVQSHYQLIRSVTKPRDSI